MKDDAKLSLVFSNSSGRLWALVQRAIRQAGFRIEDDGIRLLDKGQRSVEGLASGFENVVTMDLILTMRKCPDETRECPDETRVLQEIESAEAAAAGCSDEWAAMVWVTGTDSATRPAEDLADLAGDGAPVHVCIYRVPAGEQRSDKPRGEVIFRDLLPAGRWAAIKRQVQAAGPVQACSTPASRFALLTPDEIYVELDGCRRILAPASPRGDDTSSDTLRQAPAALPALLSKP
ncbi:hypothetical protein [Couchioplanes caeruleus]|uniref:Uncharacterized protein n=1 Tax=Couchioplanes caeruleus subsp. caeruleus TaxID=56427 RepID=A0A1K0FLC6_9ACTN|nr:hypothetical protein [Couchioplanes caeruleus]OJF13653.1 hypothetical protein BG844_14145 [Couchioplanes caeruleus subsp. caeruleus]